MLDIPKRGTIVKIEVTDGDWCFGAVLGPYRRMSGEVGRDPLVWCHMFNGRGDGLFALQRLVVATREEAILAQLGEFVNE